MTEDELVCTPVPAPSTAAHSEPRTYHCERVRKMPLSGLDPSLLLGFMCRDESEWVDLRRRIGEVCGFSYTFLSIFRALCFSFSAGSCPFSFFRSPSFSSGVSPSSPSSTPHLPSLFLCVCSSTPVGALAPSPTSLLFLSSHLPLSKIVTDVHRSYLRPPGRAVDMAWRGRRRCPPTREPVRPGGRGRLRRRRHVQRITEISPALTYTDLKSMSAFGEHTPRGAAVYPAKAASSTQVGTWRSRTIGSTPSRRRQHPCPRQSKRRARGRARRCPCRACTTPPSVGGGCTAAAR
ncbi:hypothetical protein DFH09DRAFT_201298 [Mycena vulgaris]|nr:hypothetical protein DFH09DRAFT_201298 [Mycena vulgaris]